MLKRQRPVSPAPCMPEIPLLDSTPTADVLFRHDSKRRRTQPPVLDGSSRGWASNPPEHDPSEVDYTSDDEASSSDQPYPDGTGIVLDTVDCSAENSVLRELHIQNKHRLLFTTPSSSSSSSFHSHHHIPTTTTTTAPVDRKSCVPRLSERSRAFAKSPSFPANKTEYKTAVQEPNVDELSCVIERYESVNKLLGSLFLSRRRELDSHRYYNS